MANMVRTKMRCPKCRSRDFMAIETVEAITEFDVREGQFDRADGIHELGAYIRLECQCSPCLHRWRCRRPFMVESSFATLMAVGRYSLTCRICVGVVLLGRTMEVFGFGPDSEAPSVGMLLHAGFMRLSKSIEEHGDELR